MSLFGLLVDFGIKPGAMPVFLPLMLENARLSLRDEPGCRQFDVLTAADDPNRVVLYELYDDEAAFDTHMASGHFQRFAAATGEMIATRLIRRLVLIGPDASAGARNRR